MKNLQLHISYQKQLPQPLETQFYILDENDLSVPSKEDVKKLLIKTLAQIVAHEHNEYVMNEEDNREWINAQLKEELKPYTLGEDIPMTNIFIQ